MKKMLLISIVAVAVYLIFATLYYFKNTNYNVDCGGVFLIICPIKTPYEVYRSGDKSLLLTLSDVYLNPYRVITSITYDLILLQTELGTK